MQRAAHTRSNQLLSGALCTEAGAYSLILSGRAAALLLLPSAVQARVGLVFESKEGGRVACQVSEPCPSTARSLVKLYTPVPHAIYSSIARSLVNPSPGPYEALVVRWTYPRARYRPRNARRIPAVLAVVVTCASQLYRHRNRTDLGSGTAGVEEEVEGGGGRAAQAGGRVDGCQVR